MIDSFWLPEGASSLSPQIDALFYFVTWVSGILFFGVMAAMLYLAIRYKRRGPGEVPAPVEPNKFVEISWIVLPTILVLIIFNWGFKLFIKQGIAPPDSYEIQVRASMWKWDFEYPNGTIVTGELHVPVERPVRLVMSSSDVIHSFFVPSFRVKQDVLPDRYTSVWFTATKQDTFQVFCTEYCGNGHSAMLAEVVAHSQGEFEDWLESAGAVEDLPLPELGARLYEQQMCVQCHSTDGTPGIGPSFFGIAGSTVTTAEGATIQIDENYLRQSILEPGAVIVESFQNIMPPTYSSLSERQVSALIAFIQQQSE